MDLLQFFSSIAWQIVLLVFFFSLVIFRKSIGDFLTDFKSVKIGKDGIELQQKIEEVEQKIKDIEKSDFLSERITSEKFAIEALLIWEKINITIYDILKAYGLERVKDKFKKIEKLAELDLIDKALRADLLKIRKQVDEIDKKSKDFEYREYQIFMAIANECHKKIVSIQENVVDKVEKLYDSLSNQLPIIQGWQRIGEKLLEKIKRKKNAHLFNLISKSNDNDFTKLEPIFKRFVLEHDIINEHEFNHFLKYRNLINKVSTFNEKAISELRELDIELQKQEIDALVKKIDEK